MTHRRIAGARGERDAAKRAPAMRWMTWRAISASWMTWRAITATWMTCQPGSKRVSMTWRAMYVE